MTLADLVQILRVARNSANKRGEVYDSWGMGIAGIIAVVTALRDEFREEYGMWERFTETLGDAENEKVAGGPTSNAGTATREGGACAPGTPAPAAPFDFEAHLAHQAAWSAQTFGPGPRTAGVCDHIRKELAEIEVAPEDASEWIDVVILALDGAWRAGLSPRQIIDGIEAKQAKNERRTWPDWRTADPDKAIEHDRSKDAPTTYSGGMNDLNVSLPPETCEWRRKGDRGFGACGSHHPYLPNLNPKYNCYCGKPIKFKETT